MSAGYGRGYYGKEQLAKPPRRRSSGWIKVALVVGAGAVIWLMWPRKTASAPVPGRDNADPNPLPSLPPAQIGDQGQIAQTSDLSALPLPAPVVQSTPIVPLRSLAAPITLPPPSSPSQGALHSGYASTKDYEDAVVASAKQLQDSGAKVVLAPQFAHLTPRLHS